MRPGTHPMQELLHQQMGIDTFSLDGEASRPSECWDERPRPVLLRR